MARTGFFHHIGTFFVFAAFVLLLITTISAPVVNRFSLLKVTLTNQTDSHNSSVTFGTFGYCVLDAAETNSGNDYCSGEHIGYSPAKIMEEVDGTTYGSTSTKTADDLTNVMILHPIACGLAFIAFLFALGAGIVGALFASALCAITWLITIVVMALDFALFGIVKHDVNKDGSGSYAKYGEGMWTLLAAMILLFFATFIVLFTCCSARRHKRNNATKGAEAGYVNGDVGATTQRRRFWQRRTRTTY